MFLKLPGFEFCKPLLHALEISKLTYHCLFPVVAETVKMSHVVCGSSTFRVCVCRRPAGDNIRISVAKEWFFGFSSGGWIGIKHFVLGQVADGFLRQCCVPLVKLLLFAGCISQWYNRMVMLGEKCFLHLSWWCVHLCNDVAGVFYQAPSQILCRMQFCLSAPGPSATYFLMHVGDA